MLMEMIDGFQITEATNHPIFLRKSEGWTRDKASLVESLVYDSGRDGLKLGWESAEAEAESKMDEE